MAGSPASGWLPSVAPQSGYRPIRQTFQVGDARTWSVTVAGDLSGWGAEWRLGIPTPGSLPSLLPLAYTPAEVYVLKSRSAGTLAVVSNGDGTSTLVWQTVEEDTAGLSPGVYFHQAVVVDPQGNPFTVEEGPVTLTPSLRVTQYNPPNATGLTTIATAQGFGQAVYTHALTGQGDQIPANTRTQLTFPADPGLTMNYLNPPFAGHVFWDGTKIVGRQIADALLVQVNLQVTPQVEGGNIVIDLDVGSAIGPIASDSEILGSNATVMQRISGKLLCQTNANFMANGGKIFITTSVPASILRESVFVIPLSTYSSN